MRSISSATILRYERLLRCQISTLQRTFKSNPQKSKLTRKLMNKVIKWVNKMKTLCKHLWLWLQGLKRRQTNQFKQILLIKPKRSIVRWHQRLRVRNRQRALIEMRNTNLCRIVKLHRTLWNLEGEAKRKPLKFKFRWTKVVSKENLTKRLQLLRELTKQTSRHLWRKHD